jgi:hypothetical protein
VKNAFAMLNKLTSLSITLKHFQSEGLVEMVLSVLPRSLSKLSPDLWIDDFIDFGQLSEFALEELQLTSVKFEGQRYLTVFFQAIANITTLRMKAVELSDCTEGFVLCKSPLFCLRSFEFANSDPRFLDLISFVPNLEELKLTVKDQDNLDNLSAKKLPKLRNLHINVEGNDTKIFELRRAKLTGFSSLKRVVIENQTHYSVWQLLFDFVKNLENISATKEAAKRRRENYDKMIS